MVDLEVNTLDIPFIITSKDGERINLFQSLLFDIHLSTEVETFNEVLDLVKMHLDKGITSRRIGGRSLKLLILNLYLAWKNEGASCVAISRDNNSYKARSRYNSLGISRIVVDVLDLLIDRGYVEQKIGWADPLTNRSYYTRIWGTKKLQALFEEVEFSPLDLEYDSNRETIILRDGEGENIKYADATEARFMDNEVPILIIHDSYIVPDGQESFLEGTMTWAFQEVTGKTYVPMKEDTHHPERYLPESPDDWSNAEAVEEAIKWRYDPERCDRYLRELKRFVDAKELPVNVGSGWDVSDYLEADR